MANTIAKAKRSSNLVSRTSSASRFASAAVVVALFAIGAVRSFAQNSVPSDPQTPSNLQLPSNTQASSGSQIVSDATDTIITTGDLLGVTIFDTPELSGMYRVGNDGTIRMPLVGSIKVSGMTPIAAADNIRQKFMQGNFLVDPQVLVSFAELGNHTVTVLGEIAHPGIVSLTNNRRLWDIVAFSGGVTPFAGQQVRIIHRDDMEHQEVFVVHWDRPLEGQPNPVVEAGDTIQISHAGVVYVAGEVDHPGAQPIAHEQVMLSQILTMAGGTKPTAKNSQARLVRIVGGNRTIAVVDVRRILKGDAPDIALRDGDLLYIPNSVAKAAINQGLQLAIQLASSWIFLQEARQ